jgi:hypothetical protein
MIERGSVVVWTKGTVCKYVRVRSLQFVCTGHNMLIEFICVILNICVRCYVCLRMCCTVHNTVCVVLYTYVTLCHYCIQTNTTASPLYVRKCQ